MNLKLVESRKLRPWPWTAVLGMLLACGAGDSGSADLQPVAHVQRPVDEVKVDADADVDCSIVVLATVPVDAWGGHHHVQGRLVLEGCREEAVAMQQQSAKRRGDTSRAWLRPMASCPLGSASIPSCTPSWVLRSLRPRTVSQARRWSDESAAPA
jgi:hypothetical protein